MQIRYKLGTFFNFSLFVQGPPYNRKMERQQGFLRLVPPEPSTEEQQKPDTRFSHMTYQVHYLTSETRQQEKSDTSYKNLNMKFHSIKWD